MQGQVVSLSSSAQHGFSKQARESVELIAGIGIGGDAHAGRTVQHRSRIAADPAQPNLRQVHVIPIELLDVLASEGFALNPGDLGENMLTRGIDLQALPRGTQLAFPSGAMLEVTGLRNPCAQIESFRAGLLSKMVWRDAGDAIVRRAGIMTVVLTGGFVGLNDTINVSLPDLPHWALERV